MNNIVNHVQKQSPKQNIVWNFDFDQVKIKRTHTTNRMEMESYFTVIINYNST